MLKEARAFELERRRLTLLAYRMCGSWADAEDVVQQVALEWLQATSPVQNPGGWLTRTTVRRALDRLRARQREASYVGPWLPESIVEGVETPPHAAIAQGDALSTAFLMLAEHLTPPQRAVIVLRALGYSHAEIAAILDITPAASRQHHARGHRRLTDLNGHSIEDDPHIGLTCDVARSGHETAVLLRAFLAAAHHGDVEALAGLLHGDVKAYQDGGGRTRAARRVLDTAPNVARFAVGVAALHETRRTVRFAIVNGAPGAVVTLSGVSHVLSLHLRDGRIYRVFDLCNPDKLAAGPLPPVRSPVGISRPGVVARARWRRRCGSAD